MNMQNKALNLARILEICFALGMGNDLAQASKLPYEEEKQEHSVQKLKFTEIEARNEFEDKNYKNVIKSRIPKQETPRSKELMMQEALANLLKMKTRK
jgi:hypothetical protein